MNPELIKSITGSIARWAVNVFALWMIQKGWLSEDQATQVVLYGSVALSTLVWALLVKFKVWQRIQLALNLPQGTTVQEMKDVEKYNKRRRQEARR